MDTPLTQGVVVPELNKGFSVLAGTPVAVEIITDPVTRMRSVMVGQVEIERWASWSNALFAKHAVERALGRLGLLDKGESDGR